MVIICVVVLPSVLLFNPVSMLLLLVIDLLVMMRRIKRQKLKRLFPLL
jgi:uncharacterized membrane protein